MRMHKRTFNQPPEAAKYVAWFNGTDVQQGPHMHDGQLVLKTSTAPGTPCWCCTEGAELLRPDTPKHCAKSHSLPKQSLKHDATRYLSVMPGQKNTLHICHWGHQGHSWPSTHKWLCRSLLSAAQPHGSSRSQHRPCFRHNHCSSPPATRQTGALVTVSTVNVFSSRLAHPP
jgi:hypothetical protein